MTFLQLEESEHARASAVKSKKQIEEQMEELTAQIDNLTQGKQEVCATMCYHSNALYTEYLYPIIGQQFMSMYYKIYQLITIGG